MKRRIGSRIVLSACLSTFVGCAASTPSAQEPNARVPPSQNEASEHPSLANSERAALPGTLISTIEPGSFGPHLSPTSAGWIATWETPSGPEAGWYSVFLRGSRKATPPLRIFDATPGLLHVSTASLHEDHTALLTLRQGGENQVISVALLGGQGQVLSPARVVADTPATVLWMQAVPTSSGGLCVWAERSGRSAQIFTASFDERDVTKPVRVTSDARAWQLADHAGSIGLLTLEGESRSSVRLRLLDERGNSKKAPLLLSDNSIQGGLDLDLVMTKGRIVAAWSEDRGLENRVMGALLSEKAELRKRATPLTVPRGNQALERLIADPEADTVLLMWHETDGHYGQSQDLTLGRLEGDQPAKAEATLRVARHDPLLPQLVLREDTIYGIVQTPLCESNAACPDGPAVRTAFVSSLKQDHAGAMDLRALSPSGGPSMLWELECVGDRCMALAADSGDPTRVYGVALQESQALPSPMLANDSPVVVETRAALRTVPELAELTGAQLERTQTLAWLSYFDPNVPYEVPARPAPDGRRAPVRARLETLSVPAPWKDDSRLQEQVISYRARSLGALSLVPPEPNGLLAWAAMDGSEPQLFATIVNQVGSRVRQKMLTTTPGEVTDVAAVRTNAGYLIAWVDGRDQQPEVWAMQVDDQLRSSGPVKVSHGARLPTGVALLAQSQGVLALWSDARGTTTQGTADLFVTRIDPETAEPTQEERRLVSTVTHCHSPTLAQMGSDPSAVVLSWIESRTAGGGAPGLLGRGADLSSHGSGGFHWGLWDGKSRKPTVMKVERLTSAARYSIFCRAERCGALVAAHGEHGASEVWLTSWDGASTPRVQSLGLLRSNSPVASNPLLLDDVAFIADHGKADEWVISRWGISW